jgi:hypothetical protein
VQLFKKWFKQSKEWCRRHRIITFCGRLFCVFFVVWCAIYNIIRIPANIYDELYWSCIDCGSPKAITCAYGEIAFPGMFIPAFFNPFKNTTIEDIGMEWTPDKNSVFMNKDSKAAARYFGYTFDDFKNNCYTTFVMHSLDYQFTTSETNASYVLDAVKCSTSVRADEPEKLVIYFDMTKQSKEDVDCQQDKESNTGNNICCRIEYSTKTKVAHVAYLEDVDNKEELAKSVMTCFFNLYFEKNKFSAFSVDNLGDVTYEFH